MNLYGYFGKILKGLARNTGKGIFVNSTKNNYKFDKASLRTSQINTIIHKPNINIIIVSAEDSLTIKHELYQMVQDNLNQKQLLTMHQEL